MFRDTDLNLFFTWCVNSKLDIRRTKDKYRDILDILNINMKIKKNEMPLEIQGKVQCLKTIIELHLKGSTIEGAISNVSNITKFNDTAEYLKLKVNEEINDEHLKYINDNIEMHTKIAFVSKEVGDIEKISDILSAGDYDTVEEAYDIIENVHTNIGLAIKKVERNQLIESRIILGKDDLSKTIENRMKKYDRSTKIPCGFKYIDDNILKGGFEKGRLYIYAGSSASGKSTILSNMVLNAATYKHYTGELKEKRKIFIYITLENDKEETLSRILCSHFKINDLELTRKLTDDPDGMQNKFTNDINEHNSYISLHQFNSKSISSNNIGVLIDELIDEHGGIEECMIAGIYVDYLDLLESDVRGKELRLSLNDICQQLKNIAIDYEIAVITATQLNRESFKVNNSFELNNTLIAESIGKVFVADFIALLAKNNFDDKLVHFRVGKNRSGNTDVPLDFKVDFEKFQFYDCIKSINPKEKKFGKPVEGGLAMTDVYDKKKTKKPKPVEVGNMNFAGMEM